LTLGRSEHAVLQTDAERAGPHLHGQGLARAQDFQRLLALLPLSQGVQMVSAVDSPAIKPEEDIAWPQAQPVRLSAGIDLRNDKGGVDNLARQIEALVVVRALARGALAPLSPPWERGWG
jgi:hypothetical protein